MSAGGAGPLVPTFHGFVHNSMDGLVLFEACLSGKLHHVPRRPHDRERSSLIKSGSIFIYEENASGIKRWTDGVAWSPSRILGNFLIYRELEKPFPPGEKKRAMKRKRQSMPGEPYPRRDSDDQERSDPTQGPLTPPSPQINEEVKSDVPGTDQDKELERSLIGSLVDSYGFRPDGLVKKTMSISVNGISHHMVSYYKVEDVKNNRLPRPLTDSRLANISVRPELYLKQNFRAPVEETEHYAIDGQMHAHPQMVYSTMSGAYGVRPGQYFGAPPYQPLYGLSSTASPYGAMTGTAWPQQQPLPYTGQPAYMTQPSQNYYKAPNDQSGDPRGGAQQGTPQQVYQYPSSYPGMQQPQRSAQSTPQIMNSAYQAPVGQAPSSFGSMSARTSHGGGNMANPGANGQAQQIYGNSSGQSYAVRSPTQNYQMQNTPTTTVAQSPHAIKSEHATAQSESQPMNTGEAGSHLPHAPIPYRPGSYTMAGAQHPSHPGGDMNGLGISSNAPYNPQAQFAQATSHYAQ